MGKSLVELAMAGFAALGMFGTPYCGPKSYAQETRQDVVQKVPLPPESQIKLAEKEIRELYLAEYRTSDPAKRADFGQKLLTYGRESMDNAQKYVLLRDAASTLSDLFEFDSAFEAVKALGDTFEGYKALEEYSKNLSAAQKKARSTEDVVKVAEAYLQLANEAIREKNYQLGTSSAKSAETISKMARDSSLVERATDLVKAIPDMQREYGLFKKAQAALEMNPNDPEANTTVGKYLGFVEGNWGAALERLARGINSISKAAEQELLLDGNDRYNPDLMAAVADSWYKLSQTTSNALDKTRFAIHALELYQKAQTNATGITKDKIAKRISELEKKINPLNGTAKGGWIDLMRFIDPKKHAVFAKWKFENGTLIHCGEEPNARIEIPYQPPEEYDFQIKYLQVERGMAGQILFHSPSKKQVSLLIGTFKKFVAFEQISGIPGYINETSREIVLKNNKIYTSLIEVRKTRLTAYIDGKPVTEYKYKGDPREFSVASVFNLPNTTTIGIIGHEAPIVFHDIKLREITGAGKLLR